MQTIFSIIGFAFTLTCWLIIAAAGLMSLVACSLWLLFRIFPRANEYTLLIISGVFSLLLTAALMAMKWVRGGGFYQF